uniref:peptidylprolyl isomerase n=1 Tax=Odontella aurita TaxID=265563 RepID=A0A7S4MW10_9STRA
MIRSSLLFLLIALSALVGVVRAGGGMTPESIAFLEENAKKSDVKVLSSGLQYKILRKGDGAEHPLVGTSCSCHYEGALIDGTVFDSSYERGSPTSFAPNQVIKGWTEAMQLMVEGDKWEMYIPSDLAYGDNGSPPKIPGGSALIFTMEILSIDGPSSPAVTCVPSTLGGCDDREIAYVKKIIAKYGGDGDMMETEKERIQKVSRGAVKKELLAWAKRRMILLERMIEDASDDDDDDEKDL